MIFCWLWYYSRSYLWLECAQLWVCFVECLSSWVCFKGFLLGWPGISSRKMEEADVKACGEIFSKGMAYEWKWYKSNARKMAWRVLGGHNERQHHCVSFCCSLHQVHSSNPNSGHTCISRGLILLEVLGAICAWDTAMRRLCCDLSLDVPILLLLSVSLGNSGISFAQPCIWDSCMRV